MKQAEDKHIEFVVKYYQEGKLNTRQAIERFYVLTSASRRIHFPTRRIMTIAASLAILIALSFSLLYMKSSKADEVTIATTNTSLTYLLKDGSKIVLAPFSTLSYNQELLQKGERRLKLQGKAYFQIHHDNQHPCFIETQLGNIKVLGTIFQVDVKEQATDVYVESGKVCFYEKSPSQGLILTKHEGGRLEKGTYTPRPTTWANNPTSWATGIFHFDHTPIKEALEEISEYCKVMLTTDATDKYLTGDIEIKNEKDAKDIVESILDIHVNIKKNHTR